MRSPFNNASGLEVVEAMNKTGQPVKRDTYIDPTAEVHENAIIFEGAMIWNWSKIREGARVGADTNIGQNVYVDFDVVIGDRSKVQNGVSIYHGVTIGSDVFVGPNVTFTNDLFPRAHNESWQVIPTQIEDGASIGANATIVCGVRLGRHCMIGAGAVVTVDVPSHALVMGCPARIVDYVTVSGKRLHVSADLKRPNDSILSDNEKS